MRPKRLLSAARLRSCSVALRRFCFTTKRRTGFSSHARTMRSPSCQRVAMGFSVITWKPAFAHSIACSGCRPEGVASTTMSALVAASIFVTESWPRAPVCFTAFASAAASVSQTSTSSARSACLAMAAKWLAAMRPHPASAKRILRPLIGGAYWRMSGLDDVVRGLEVLAARIDDELGVLADHFVVEPGVIGREQHAVVGGERFGRQGDALQVELVLAQLRED